MAIVNNPSIASKSKHIDVKFDFFKGLCMQEIFVSLM